MGVDKLYDLVNNTLLQNASKVMIEGDFNYHFSIQFNLF